MKTKIFFGAFVLAVMGLVITSCDNDVETMEIQSLYKYDAQYFENLRTWKKTDHEISYAYYASWSNSQNPTSWGERFLGLPDSMDIVNLWTDIPTPESYPVAYKDMVYCQNVKGTRFVMHGNAPITITLSGIVCGIRIHRSSNMFMRQMEAVTRFLMTKAILSTRW